MATVQIPEDVFMDLWRYHCAGIDMAPDRAQAVQIALNDKYDRLLRRQRYSAYKGAQTDAERNQAKQRYIDAVRTSIADDLQ